MLCFCLRSLFTEYGWLFMRHVALVHPIKTFRAFYQARRADSKGDLSVSTKYPEEIFASNKSIVGVGFCMKPKIIPCPSINDHHGCKYLESYDRNKDANIPDACKGCYIKKIGLAALKSNTAFYIMTSAKDILFDVFKPALDNKIFETGLFILCRYSFKPFFIGMNIAGIKGYLFPFCSGDCNDYETWIKADRGEKIERTDLDFDIQTRLENLLSKGLYDTEQALKIEKRGNIFYPF